MNRRNVGRGISPLKCGCSITNTGIAQAGQICRKCGGTLRSGLPTLREFDDYQRQVEAEAEERLP